MSSSQHVLHAVAGR